MAPPSFSFFFFFNDTATTEIYTLSLHDALPISSRGQKRAVSGYTDPHLGQRRSLIAAPNCALRRSEEHTSGLQSPCNLVCRLLLEKKKKTTYRRCRPHDRQRAVSSRPGERRHDS